VPAGMARVANTPTPIWWVTGFTTVQGINIEGKTEARSNLSSVRGMLVCIARQRLPAYAALHAGSPSRGRAIGALFHRSAPAKAWKNVCFFTLTPASYRRFDGGARFGDDDSCRSAVPVLPGRITSHRRRYRYPDEAADGRDFGEDDWRRAGDHAPRSSSPLTKTVENLSCSIQKLPLPRNACVCGARASDGVTMRAWLCPGWNDYDVRVSLPGMNNNLTAVRSPADALPG
jgi:hypothetical protein